MSKLNIVLENGVVKKSVYNELVEKINAIIDASGLFNWQKIQKTESRKSVITINMLLLMVLINFKVQYLMKDQSKQK